MLSRSSIAGCITMSSFAFVAAAAGCAGGGAASAPTTIAQTASDTQTRVIQGFAPPLSPGTTLFAQDFENGSQSGWTPRLGSAWSVCKPPGASHEFCTPGTQVTRDALATAGSAAWTNYEVDAWTVPGSASIGGVELVGRYVDEQHFYQLGLRALNGSQTWAISKNTGGVWKELAGGPAAYVGGRYYHLRLVLNGASLTAYATTAANDFHFLSEKQLGTGTDTAYSAGAIGVRAIAGIPARFDNVGAYALSSPSPAPSQAPPANPALRVPSGFYVEKIASVRGARQLVVASNGDLIVGTTNASIQIVPNAEGDGVAGAPQTLIALGEADAQAQGIALAQNGALYVGTSYGVWTVPYTPGTLSAPTATKIASIRTGSIAPHSDGDVHRTTSLVISGSTLYVGIGSSCNACTEVDPTRASVQAMRLDGSGMHTFATRIRNPIAFAVDPATGMVFTGGAGQDSLAELHPYEYLDALNSHAAGADYGWPQCEENHHAYTAGSDCAHTIQPSIEFPAYSTIIGAAYYPKTHGGTYAFPAAYRGGIFVSMHGSWHTLGGTEVDAPHVAFVPMNGDVPAKPVDWNNPTAQWTDFFTGFQAANGTRIGRTTGVAVGPRGSLFVGDDDSESIYRIRPGVRP